MKYRITYVGGKIKECDVPDFASACKFANAYPGLVEKVVKLDSCGRPPESGIVEYFSPSEIEPENRIVGIGKTINTMKRGRR